jgi:hypothetical protein
MVTVARSQENLPAGFGRKFGQIRKNSAFFKTSVLRHPLGNKNVKRPVGNFTWVKLAKKIYHKR